MADFGFSTMNHNLVTMVLSAKGKTVKTAMLFSLNAVLLNLKFFYQQRLVVSFVSRRDRTHNLNQPYISPKSHTVITDIWYLVTIRIKMPFICSLNKYAQ